MNSKRYVTKSDRLIEYRHKVARPVNEELLEEIRSKWWEIESQYRKEPHIAGLMMFEYLRKLFATGTDEIVIEEEEFDFNTLTEYEEKDCIDYWDLSDTQEIEP
jgi:hypothetical protein